MKRILQLLLLALLILVGYILFNTFTFPSKQIKVEAVSPSEVPSSATQNLSQAIQIKTVSNENIEDIDSAAFYQFRVFIKTAYPLIDSLLEVTYINEFSMIFKWQGLDTALKPGILMGHLDVVPVAEENRSSWSAEPFGGEIKDGIIWGRGAIDDKVSVIGTLEAAELLLQERFQPKRTMYFCFGHDEEIGGEFGAVSIVKHLKNEGVKAEFVIDEGFAITQGLVPGIDKDVALIGTAEKGFVSLHLSVNMEGGHSSMPEPETTLDVLAKAVVKLKENPFPAELVRPVLDFMAHAGPEMPFIQKMAFANPALFKSMIISTYEAQPSGNAIVRTTTAPTIISGGLKENVIPYQAKAVVNFRILPGTSIEEVKARVKEVINDERITISESAFNSEAPESSSVDSFGYQLLNKTIKQIFPDVITTPNLVVGATDSRHYYPLSPNIYRFTPFYLNEDNITSFHGINERLPVEEFEDAVRFYVQLLRNGSISR